MKLTEEYVEALRAAAEKIGEYGKITLLVSGGVVDVIIENRIRIQNGKQALVPVKQG